MKHKLFVYGTMRKGMANHAVLLRTGVKALGQATYPEGHSKMMDMGAAPALTASVYGPAITGEVYEVNTSMLRLIDTMEGVPSFVVRRRIKVWDYDGNVHRAWCHFMREDVSDPRKKVEAGDWAAYLEAAAAPPVKVVTPSYTSSNATFSFAPMEQDKLFLLKEGETITLLSRGGSEVTYTRKDGTIKLLKWVPADKVEAAKTLEEWEGWEGPAQRLTGDSAKMVLQCEHCEADVVWFNGDWLDDSSSPKCLHSPDYHHSGKKLPGVS